jgi:PilZ domain
MDLSNTRAEPVPQRKADRVPLSAEVQLRSGTRRAVVKVNNLSATGARIAVAQMLRTDDQIYLKLPGLEAIEARVVWVDSFEAGCEFVRPLHPATFEAVVRAI